MDVEKLNHADWKPTRYCDVKMVELDYAAELHQSFEYIVVMEIGKLKKQLEGKGIEGLDEMLDDLIGRIHQSAMATNGKLSVAKQTMRIYKD